MDDDPSRTAIWTHAGAYLAHPRTELVAAADRDQGALEGFCRRWGVRNQYQTAVDLLDHEAVDILSVCTWSDSHPEMALLGAKAGVKAIWCEKPVATSLSEADRMLEGCRDVVLAVNHVRRWDDCYRKTRELVRSGAIGKARHALCAYSGGISNIGTHLFDTLSYMLGEPETVWAFPGAAYDLPDPSPNGVLTFRGGITAHLAGCDPRDYLIFEIDILGSEGRLRVINNGYRAELWQVVDSPRYSLVRELELSRLVHEGDEGDRMVNAVSDIIHCIEHGGRPSCGGREGRAALELTAAFIKSYNSGCKVNLPLAGRDLVLEVPVR